MESPPASPPPDYTGFYDKYHTEKIYNRPNLTLPKAKIAPTLEDALQYFEHAKDTLERATGYLDYLKREYPSSSALLEQERKVAQADVDKMYAHVRVLRTEIAEKAKKPERSTGPLEPRAKGPSAIFPNLKVAGRRLHTRRAKKRNGSSAILRHRTRHMPRRKVQA